MELIVLLFLLTGTFSFIIGILFGLGFELGKTLRNVFFSLNLEQVLVAQKRVAYTLLSLMLMSPLAFLSPVFARSLSVLPGFLLPVGGGCATYKFLGQVLGTDPRLTFKLGSLELACSPQVFRLLMSMLVTYFLYVYLVLIPGQAAVMADVFALNSQLKHPCYVSSSWWNARLFGV